MRKLKLQMQIAADGFVAGPHGQLDWMTSVATDDRLLAFINHLTDTSDTILLGRRMTPGFIGYWESVVTKPESSEHAFSQKMVDMPKVVFSKTLDRVDGQNVRVKNGELVARRPGRVRDSKARESGPEISAARSDDSTTRARRRVRSLQGNHAVIRVHEPRRRIRRLWPTSRVPGGQTRGGERGPRP